MPLEEKTLFKKSPVPWYASVQTCFFLLIVMVILFLFGLAGVSVAYETEAYGEYAWVPALLVVLSGTIVLSTSIRLIKRSFRRLSR